ncbi:unnamed protein product [Cylindrotheca closterium]|uniref:Uncharacterized protein n=1 Tax=Cylindrotheca closterium TaxID=2856 RepID=A0AAD2CE09_9STRA|nr:unnamed protein product [Cylindrotheca closterium]
MQSLSSTRPKQGTETPSSRSTSSDPLFCSGAFFLGGALAPMRNVTQEFDTRAICMSTSAMRDIPALTWCPEETSDNSDDDEEEMIPTFSLVRRKEERGQQCNETEQDASNITRSTPSRSFKKLSLLSRPTVSPIGEILFKSE